MKKVFFISNIFPHYRKSIWNFLLQNDFFDMTIFFGANNSIGIFSPSIKKIFSEEKAEKIISVKNYWVLKKHLLWQSNLIFKLLQLKFDCIILIGDIVTLSNWVLLFMAKARKKKIIIWSHGIYGNENFIKKRLRLFQLSLCDDILLYGDRAKSILINHGFNENTLHVIYNSLDYLNQKKFFENLKINNYEVEFFSNRYLPTIIFIGRLTKIKKIPQLLDALDILNIEKHRYNLLIIGDGPEKQSLEKRCSKLINERKVYFYGSSYDEKELSKLIYTSDLCVSPGNIGLTAIHSLTYNTPVATHNNFNNQMPEAEIILNGVNGFLFEENNIYDLADKINLWFSKQYIPSNFRDLIDEKYNPSYQLSKINEAINRK